MSPEMGFARRRGEPPSVGRFQRSPGRSVARIAGHEHRDPVEHGCQACFELRCPAVLGEPGRQAVHRRETPGVDLACRIDQLARAAGVLDHLPLLSGAGRAQAAENRIRGRSPGGFAAVARSGVGAAEGSVTRLGIPERHGAGFQQQVTEQEAVERAVCEQYLLVAEPLSGQSAQHRLNPAQRPKRRINPRRPRRPGSDQRESMRMRQGVAAHSVRHSAQVRPPPVHRTQA